jgi:hypothetical protein
MVFQRKKLFFIDEYGLPFSDQHPIFGLGPFEPDMRGCPFEGTLDHSEHPSLPLTHLQKVASTVSFKSVH